MKPRFRSSLLLLVTLGLGMVLGALIQGSLRDKRMKHFHFMRDESTFVSGIENALGPVDAGQADAIRTILEGTAPKVMENIRTSRQRVRQELEIMKTALAPLLTPEQQARLAERLLSPRERRKQTQEGQP